MPEHKALWPSWRGEAAQTCWEVRTYHQQVECGGEEDLDEIWFHSRGLLPDFTDNCLWIIKETGQFLSQPSALSSFLHILGLLSLRLPNSFLERLQQEANPLGCSSLTLLANTCSGINTSLLGDVGLHSLRQSRGLNQGLLFPNGVLQQLWRLLQMEGMYLMLVVLPSAWAGDIKC